MDFNSILFPAPIDDKYDQIYNNKGNLIFTVWFRNCRLESISDIALTSTSDGVINTFSLSLQYEWFELSHEGLTEEEKRQFNIYPKSQIEPESCGCECKCRSK